MIVSGNTAVLVASQDRPLPAVTLTECLATSDVPGKYMSTFLGMVPAKEPRLVILAMLDEPDYAHHYASQSAAPLFGRIVQEIGRSTDWLVGAEAAAHVRLPRRARAAARAVAHDAQARGVEAVEGRLVRVQHRDAVGLAAPVAPQQFQDAHLRAQVVVEVGVVVQVVARQVRHHRGVQREIGRAVLVQGVGGDLQRDGAAAVPAHLGQQAVEGRAVGRGQRRREAARLGVPLRCDGTGYVAEQTPPPGLPIGAEGIAVRMVERW